VLLYLILTHSTEGGQGRGHRGSEEIMEGKERKKRQGEGEREGGQEEKESYGRKHEETKRH
jgi:hypothetical protein